MPPLAAPVVVDPEGARSELVRPSPDRLVVRRLRDVPDAQGRLVPTVVQQMVGDHVVVMFKAGTTRADVAAAAARHGGVVRRDLGFGNAYLISFAAVDAGTVAAMCRAMLAEPQVAVAEPDYIVTVRGIPNDARFGEQWGLHNTGQGGGTADADIDAPEAWDLATGSRSVLVGILDSGLDRNHPDLQANLWSNPGETGLDANGHDKRTNGIDDDGNGFVDDWRGWNFVAGSNDPSDDNGHGTHCAGGIGAVGGNGLGVSGVCRQVSLVGIKWLDNQGSGTYSAAAQAIHYATTIGCSLTSNSWGGQGSSSLVTAAIAEAAAAGHLFVVAAGNESLDTDATPMFPTTTDAPNVISVAATTRTDGLAGFSNWGRTTVDLGAPGQEILSTIPNGAYASWSGTSMATPLVSGVAALLLGVRPNLTPVQVKGLILGSVDPIPSLRGKVVTGGRLNARRALEHLNALIAHPERFPADGVLPSRWDFAPLRSIQPWQVVTDHVSEGIYSLASASGLGAGQESRMVIDGVWQAGTVSFDSRVSSLADVGVLRFTVDGLEQLKRSGEADWQHSAVTLSAGRHQLAWTYRKDGVGTAGSDRAWIDDVALPAFSDPPADPEVFPPANGIPAGWLTAVAGSSTPWSVVADGGFEGTHALRSGLIGDSRKSILAISGTWEAGAVSFARRVSSEAGYDFLRFVIDGAVVGEWSGEVPWGMVAFPITAGTHVVRWEYGKDEGATDGQDAAWIDAVDLPAFTAGPLPPVVEVFPPANDIPTGWTNNGSGSTLGWTVATDTAHEGVLSLRSGAIAGSQTSAIQATGTFASGTISFARRVSSESGFDFLRLVVDGTLLESWSGPVPWSVVTYPITAGHHTVRWEYVKDGTVSIDEDAAWIDAVSLPGFISDSGDAFPVADVMPADWQSAPAGSQAGWSVTTDTAQEGMHSLASGTVGDGQCSAVEVGGGWEAGTVSFARRVSCAAGDALRYLVDGVEIASWSGEVPWSVIDQPLSAGMHVLRWEYRKGTASHGGIDRAWIDAVTLPRRAPEVVWPAPAAIAYGTALSAVQLNAVIHAAGTTTYQPAAGTRLAVGQQVLSLTWMPDDGTHFLPASATVAVTVTPAAATITAPDVQITYDGLPHALTTTTVPVGLPVVVTYDGSSDPPVQAGDYAVVATINHPSYGGRVERRLSILQATPVVTWNALPALTYGTAVLPSMWAPSSSVAGSVSYDLPTNGVLPVGTNQVTAVFTPDDRRNYRPLTRQLPVVVRPRHVTVTLAGLVRTYDGRPQPAVVTSDPPGIALTVTYGGRTAAPVSAGNYALSVSSADGTSDAQASGLLVIQQASPGLAWDTPAAITPETALGPPQLCARSVFPGTFRYAPGQGISLASGSHVLTATFVPEDPLNVAAGSVSTTIEVTPAAASATQAAIGSPATPAVSPVATGSGSSGGCGIGGAAGLLLGVCLYGRHRRRSVTSVRAESRHFG